MYKQALIYLILSIVIVWFSHTLYLGMIYLNTFFATLSAKLRPLFSWTPDAYGLTKLLEFVLVPIIVTAIPALIYRLVTGKNMPHFIAITWCIWWILILSYILIR